MAVVLERPDDAAEVMAVMSGISMLAECCRMRGPADDDAQAAWTAMATWLGRVSNRYLDLVERRDSAALILLAHWAVLADAHLG